MMKTSEFFMQGEYAGMTGRAGQNRCSEMPCNGSAAAGLLVDIIETEMKSASGCVTGGEVVGSGSDTADVSMLEAATHLDDITGVFETEPAHAERANDENIEKDGNKFEKRRGWRSMVRRPVRCMRFLKEAVQGRGACSGRPRNKQVEIEASLGSYGGDAGEGDSRDSEKEGSSSFNQGRSDTDEHSWVSERAQRLKAGLKRLVNLDRRPLLRCLRGRYRTDGPEDPLAVSLSVMKAWGMVPSGSR